MSANFSNCWISLLSSLLSGGSFQRAPFISQLPWAVIKMIFHGSDKFAIFYFLITYGVCKKRKYCNRISEKEKNSLLLMNVHVFCVIEHKTSKKKFRCVCLSVGLVVWLYVRMYHEVVFMVCTDVRGFWLWTQ